MKLTLSQLRLIVRKSLLEGVAWRNDLHKDDSQSNNSNDNKTDMNIPDINFLFEEIPTPEFANKALSELNFWKGKKESDPTMLDRLSSYWDSIKSVKWSKKGGGGSNIWDATTTPWSAAFITYVTGDDSFFDSADHVTWKDKAVKNTEEVSKDPDKYKGKIMYIALSTNQAKPEKGNNVWRPREGGSHSDIAISDKEGIGGNLSNSVSKIKINHPIVIKKVKILGKKESTKNNS